MAINKVQLKDGTVKFDCSGVTVTPATLAKGTTAMDNTGTIITGLMEGGSLPTGISAIKFGTYTVSSDFTTSRQTVTHGLGVTPDLVLFWHNGNIATTYSMLWAMRCTQMGYRSSAYNSYYAYHGNSTTTVTLTNANSTSYGVSNLTATTFQIASHSTSYYWRKETYNWVAVKFS